jgi:hypothetical protein
VRKDGLETTTVSVRSADVVPDLDAVSVNV